MPRPTKKNRQFYLQKRMFQKSDEEIAAIFNVKVSEVKKGIEAYESYRFMASAEEIELAINNSTLNLIDEAERVVRDAMSAKSTKVIIDPLDPEGKRRIEVEIVDHSTRLKAYEMFQKSVETVRPKNGNVTNVNVQQNNANIQAGLGPGQNFESRVRMLRERRIAQGLERPSGLMLDAGSEEREERSQADILSAEFEDAGLDIDADKILDEIENQDWEDAESPTT